MLGVYTESVLDVLMGGKVDDLEFISGWQFRFFGLWNESYTSYSAPIAKGIARMDSAHRIGALPADGLLLQGVGRLGDCMGECILVKFRFF